MPHPFQLHDLTVPDHGIGHALQGDPPIKRDVVLAPYHRHGRMEGCPVSVFEKAGAGCRWSPFAAAARGRFEIPQRGNSI